MIYTKIILLNLFFLTLSWGSDPVIISRADWNADPPKSVKKLKVIPPEYIVIHHSAGPFCNVTKECKTVVKAIQKFHMDNQKWSDIGYNFLVGGDGKVYEGRGWNVHGSHLPSLNSKSLGVCLLGNFENIVPNNEQIQATKDLIAYAEKNNYLSAHYNLIGHKQRISTQCPGTNLYDMIVNWPHWTNEI